MAKQNVGVNIELDETKTHYILRIAKVPAGEEPHGRSKSEKTITLATTRGNHKHTDSDGNDVFFGLNHYRYPEK